MKGTKTQIIVRIVLLIGLIALVGGVFWYWLRPPQVTIAEVTERKITPSIQGVGTVEAKIVVMVAAKIPGKVISINVDQGDTVLPGQVLATLEDSESRAEIERSEATLQRSRTSAEVQRATIQRSLSGIEIQRASLRRSIAVLLASETAISRARALQKQAQLNADRWIKLERDGVVSKMDTEERVTQVKTATEDLKNTEAQRKAASEDVKHAEALLKAANDDVATAKAGLHVIEQDINIAEATLSSTRARESDTVIVSQISGYVVSRELEPGAIVNPGTPILKVADPTTGWATVYVDEINTRAFVVGDAAEITFRSMQERKLQGKVARIRRESDRVTEQLAVDISFDQLPENLRLGEQVEATIRPRPRTAMVIPASALIRSKDGFGAWTVEDGRLRFRKVQTGMIDASGWAEVIAGFAQGDKVVVSPGKLADLSNEGRRITTVAADVAEEQQVRP